MKFKHAVTVAAIVSLIGGTAFASPTLSRNSRGNDVLILQKKLYLIGYEISELDGVYGSETERAVSAFQRDNKISVTGVVTNVTWRALRKAKEKKGRVLPSVTGTNPAKSYEKFSITNAQANQIISSAQKFLGVSYVFGGNTPKGFDCSGLLQYVFNLNGISIPRMADEQYQLGKEIKRNQLAAGDLVFFSTYQAGVSHCGIYIGNGKFLHASSSKGVSIDSLDSEYWKSHFVGAKKITA